MLSSLFDALYEAKKLPMAEIRTLLFRNSFRKYFFLRSYLNEKPVSAKLYLHQKKGDWRLIKHAEGSLSHFLGGKYRRTAPPGGGGGSDCGLWQHWYGVRKEDAAHATPVRSLIGGGKSRRQAPRRHLQCWSQRDEDSKTAKWGVSAKNPCLRNGAAWTPIYTTLY